jgi:DNA-binding GntR family transcriptional regulator
MDTKFHLLIYRFAGSTPLYDTLMPLHKKVLKYRRASVENEVRSAYSSQEHRAIFEAIAAHDGDRAEELMRVHIANAKDYIHKKGNS